MTNAKSKNAIKTPIENLRDGLKNIRKQLYCYIPKVKDSVPSKLHATASLEEEVSYTRTLIEVTIDEASDGKYLEPLVGKSKANQIKVTEVLKDAAYSSKANLEYMEKEKVTVITSLNPILSNGKKRELEGFEYNKDVGQMRFPTGHLSIKKARTGKKKQFDNQRMTYCFGIEKCKTCPLRDGCYKPGVKSKNYSVTIKSGTHQKAIDYQNKNEFQSKKTTL